MSRPRRIITIIDRHRRGGQSKRMYMMIEALLDAGFEVHYLSAEKLQLKEDEYLVAHILPLPVRKLSGFWFWLCFNIVAPFMLAQLAIRKRAVAIAVFDTYYSAIAKLASLLSWTPVILFMRSVPWRVSKLSGNSILRRGFSYLLDYIGLRFAKTVVAVTSTMQEELGREVPSIRKRIVTLPYAVVYPPELDESGNTRVEKEKWDRWVQALPERRRKIIEEYELPEKGVVLSSSGELNNRKNIEHLVRAIGASKNNKLSLVVCGDGPEKMRISAIIAGYGLQQRVVLCGWLDDPVNVVAGSDLFVMPSRHEGMALALLEALGAGTAVLAADTPEMREVLHYDELLFDPDHVGKLVEKLDRSTSKKSELDRLRELSHERARHFAFHWGREVVSLFEKLAERD